MSYQNLVEIDFEGIWKSQLEIFGRSNITESTNYWDRRADTFDNNTKRSSYASDLLERIKFEPHYSVLDIGCGNGSITIPVAKQVDRVTALDLSPEMLNILTQNIDRTNTNNITIVHKSWDEVEPGTDIPQHDIVLASRCLSGQDLSNALGKIDISARQACYITWRTERKDSFKARLHELLGSEHFMHPEYPLILNVLYKLGIHANLEHFESVYEETYSDIAEAMSNLAPVKQLSFHTTEELTAFINSNYDRQNGGYYRKSSMRWVLIWWLKQ